MGKQQKTPDRIPGCVGALGGADSLSATRAITGTGSLGEDRLQRGPGRPTCCPARGGGGAGGQGGGGGGVAAAPDSEEGGGGDGTENKQEGTGKLVDGDPPSVITGRTRVLTLPREVRARPPPAGGRRQRRRRHEAHRTVQGPLLTQSVPTVREPRPHSVGAAARPRAGWMPGARPHKPPLTLAVPAPALLLSRNTPADAANASPPTGCVRRLDPRSPRPGGPPGPVCLLQPGRGGRGLLPGPPACSPPGPRTSGDGSLSGRHRQEPAGGCHPGGAVWPGGETHAEDPSLCVEGCAF